MKEMLRILCIVASVLYMELFELSTAMHHILQFEWRPSYTPDLCRSVTFCLVERDYVFMRLLACSYDLGGWHAFDYVLLGINSAEL